MALFSAKNINAECKSASLVLRSVFGYSSFREEQERIIQTVLDGNNAFVLMPTGAGKSLCYQIPAIVRPGVGLVVSPLIALMQNQVRALKLLGINAAFLNSSLSIKQAEAVERQVIDGQLDLLYVAPERLLMPKFLQLLKLAKIALFAIDEAHCVSQWGHDFRPEYSRLSVLEQEFSNIPRIALTATADELTRKDIIKNLGLSSAKIFISGFDRPNIQYRVVEKLIAKKQLLEFIKTEHAAHSGVVYCLSRKGVDDTQSWLKENGINALPYHAGMSNKDRQNNQIKFLEDEGVVIVATIAFGMGIDKPNIRFVAHLNLPKSLEEYYQETGRAGRDGQPANAWMAYGLQDVIIHRQRLDQSQAEDAQKIIEKRKLEAMLGYSESTSCRRETLLKYFNDNFKGPCNNCDSCLTPIDKWDASVPVQKAMSCIFRTKQIFGVAHLIDVLLGKNSVKVQKFFHNKLSVFGVGLEYTAHEWRSIFRQLIAMGMINVDHEKYGAFKLAYTSLPVLKGEQRIFLRRISKKSKSKSANTARTKPIATINQDLFDILKTLRAKIAKELKVPPYLIFHDRSISEMAQTKPRTREELSQIHGVGEHKLNKYADAFLNIINKK